MMGIVNRPVRVSCNGRYVRMWRWIKDFLKRRNPRSGLRLVIHRGYQVDIPFPQYDARRPFRILQYLRGQKLLHRGMLVRPRPISLRRMELVHDRRYLKSLDDPGAMEAVLGFRLGASAQDRFLCFQRLMCGGTLRAALGAVRRGSVMVNLGGGLHHANRNSGSGFCAFNDVAVAIASLRRRDFDKPILVVDLDLHDGDGTRSIFANDPSVHTFSIHNRDLGSTEAVASTAIALGTEVEDAAYLAAIEQHLPEVFAKTKPGLVFYLAGSDPCVDDRLGDWRVSLEGLLKRDQFVMNMVRPHHKAGAVPVVILLAGGYGPNAWRHGAAFMSWLTGKSSGLEIPPEMELPVDHYRRLGRFMQNPRLIGETGSDSGDNDWGLQEEEISGTRPIWNERFLGLFSRHGLEMSLEEIGLLDRLRGLGFTRLAVDTDLDDPLGHTLRITTRDEPPLTVMEIRLRIDRSALPGRSLLMVEWLLIQDARASFEISRPLLPGQKYPGLGLLRDTAAVLIVLCEHLELDGLAFTPSHFHLACLSDPQSSFLDPALQARFKSLLLATANLRPAEAAASLAAGRIRERAGGAAVTWVPGVMVLPVSQGLKEYFAGDEYLGRVSAAHAPTFSLEQ